MFLLRFTGRGTFRLLPEHKPSVNVDLLKNGEFETKKKGSCKTGLSVSNKGGEVTFVGMP